MDKHCIVCDKKISGANWNKHVRKIHEGETPRYSIHRSSGGKCSTNILSYGWVSPYYFALIPMAADPLILSSYFGRMIILNWRQICSYFNHLAADAHTLIIWRQICSYSAHTSAECSYHKECSYLPVKICY